jgi:adenosine deaminase
MSVLVNLHSHLEGRVRPSTAAELAPALGLDDPPQGWAKEIALDAPGTLTQYLMRVAATYPFFRSVESVRRIAREAVMDAAAGGQSHLELRFGPATHAVDPSGIDETVRAACEGLRDGTGETGISAGIVLAALRHHDSDTNELVAHAAARAAGSGVVGFDLAGDELLHPALEPHQRAFGIARASGLGITCHAAEAGPASAARRAVELLGASRIGHGAHIVDDPAVLSWCADHGIVVEICPTSNVFTGAITQLDQHPEGAFRAAGVSLVLGDDNPMQTGSDLANERSLLQRSFGWDDASLARLDRDSIAAAFLEPAERTRLQSLLS